VSGKRLFFDRSDRFFCAFEGRCIKSPGAQQPVEKYKKTVLPLVASGEKQQSMVDIAAECM